MRRRSSQSPVDADGRAGSSSWVCGQGTTERLGIWILRILTYLIWGIVALLALAFLSLIVIYAGAALGLWPISDQ